MTAPKPTDFAEFFRAVYGYDPFPWQARLAERVCGGPNAPGEWPRCIALPTAAGKTACIDIAVFALACQASLRPEQRTAPRRIFFVVDRRVVVDQAYDHAERLSEALQQPQADILKRVAAALTHAGADHARPLDVYALRGGMYRESAWVRSPLQPTVLTSTVDQVGSRLLFRGYGVSDASKPLHAALVGNDSLILLDEAHCARPFDQTMQLVSRYRDWAEDGHALPLPFHFVTMTATPGDGIPENEIEKLGDDDRNHPVLGKRMAASKPAWLVVADIPKGSKWREGLVKTLVGQAERLQTGDARAVGIIVNRVATAREVAARLHERAAGNADVVLLTGRMRPVDRDAIMTKIEPLLSNSSDPLTKPTFVVATQTLEVGADLDFHALVTECASLDALRQRFGRLNRVAVRENAEAVIVVRADQADPEKDDDPVYGNSLANTWIWLNTHAEERQAEPGSTPSPTKAIDFGVEALRRLLTDPTTKPEDPGSLNAPSSDAAVLLPAYIDMWCQTSPRPAPDPDPSYFLHGPQRGEPEVQVVFRADLGEDSGKWAEIVSLCPPSSPEALSVRLGSFRRWLADRALDERSSDVEGERIADERDDTQDMIPAVPRRTLRWRGPDSQETAVIDTTGAVTPNDTYVVPITNDDQRRAAALLGDFPTGPDGTPRIADAGDEAFQRSRDKAVLRLVPALYPQTNAAWSTTDFSMLDDDEIENQVTEALEDLSRHDSPHVSLAAKELGPKNRRTLETHPLGGLVLIGKRRLHRFNPAFVEPEDSWDTATARQYALADHCRDVAQTAKNNADRSGLAAAPAAAIERAGELHDIGKADPRFQAILHGSPAIARISALLVAKSYGETRSWTHHLHARDRSEYPKGGRHELYSTWMAAHHENNALGGIDPVLHDLVLHLIASHHGFCRPFAPIATGDLERTKPAATSNGMARLTTSKGMEEFTFVCDGRSLTFKSDSSISGHGLERIDSGVAERFWALTRRYGWWGLAYLEAMLRLADWACSEPSAISDHGAVHATDHTPSITGGHCAGAAS